MKLERSAWQIEPAVCLQRQKQVLECFKSLIDFLDRHWDTRTADLGWKVASIMSLDHIMVFVILGETLRNAIIQLWPVPREKSPLRCYMFWRIKIHSGWMVS